MASRTTSFDILVKVRDLASRKLDRTARSLKNTGRAGKTASQGVKEFNRTLFATTAFIGTLQRAFGAVSSAMDIGTEFDRLGDQFERNMGPRGALFAQIRTFTDNSIDRFEALRAGIALSRLGMTRDLSETAELIAMAGTAAKQAGLDSGEGIKRFTQFLKDGSVSHLSFLNIVAQTNPKLQAELSILQSSTGVMGTMISTQRKLIIGRRLLAAATKDNLKGHRDLRDTYKDLGESFKSLRAITGGLISRAFQPLMERVIDLFDTLSINLDTVVKTDKNLMFLGKTALVAATGVTTLVGSLITLKLVLTALTALGFGIPALIGSVTVLTASFLTITSSADGFIDKLKLLGAVFRGTWQLVHSFLSDPENFAKGIGQMDKGLKNLLDKNGLLGFVENLSRGTILAIQFGKGLIDGIGKGLKFIGDTISFVLGPFRELLGISSGPWANNLIDRFKQVGEVVGKVAVAVGGLIVVMKLLRGLRGAGGLVGGMGGLGKGGLGGIVGGKPIPVWVVNMGGSGMGGGFGGGKGGGKLPKGVGRVGKMGRFLKGGGLLALLGAGFTAMEIADIAGNESLSYGQKSQQIGGASGGLAGGLGGAAAGATAGSLIFPGIGTAIGAILGGVGGAMIGDHIGEAAGDKFAELFPQAKTEAAKTQIAIPETQEGRVDALFNQMREIENAESRKLAANRMEYVLENQHKGEGQGIVTDEEFKAMLELMTGYMKQVADNTDNKPMNMQRRSSSGGGL